MSNTYAAHRALDAHRAVGTHEDTFGTSPDAVLSQTGSVESRQFLTALAALVETRSQVTVTVNGDTISGTVGDVNAERNSFNEVTGLTFEVHADDDLQDEPTTVDGDDVEVVLVSGR